MMSFVCKIFQTFGVTDKPYRLSGGWTNHVFAAGEYVLRCTEDIQSARLRREMYLVKQLPESVGYPEIIACGQTDSYDWMLCRKVPGTNLEEVWDSLSWDQRADAFEELWKRVKNVHSLDIQMLRPYTNENLWYISSMDYVLKEAEFLTKRNILSFEQHNIVGEYIRRFLSAQKYARSVLVHGDLTPANTMWHKGRITALMDFECAAIAQKEADLFMLLDMIYDNQISTSMQVNSSDKQRFHTRLLKLIQDEMPNWDNLLGYAVIKLMHHVVMDIDDEDFSSDHEELVRLRILLDNHECVNNYIKKDSIECCRSEY